MATRTKPLVSAALASAAAVAVVSPAITPNLPTPAALSKAAYHLTTFADVLSIPASVWTDVLFGNDVWGGTLGPDSYGPDWAAPQSAFAQAGYVNPWAAYCNNQCVRTGLPGVAYLVSDALINGNGNGYDDYENWKIGLVNYFWEPNATFQIGNGSSYQVQVVDAGLSSAAWYLLQGSIGRLVPSLQVPLAGAFWGPANVSVFYNFGLSIAALASGAIPIVGPLAGNSILAYLGDLALSQGTEATYQYGLSGLLNYWVDLATKAVPWPTQVPWYRINPTAAVAPPAATVSALSASAESTDKKAESESDDDSTEVADTESSHDEGTETEGTETEGTETEGTETHGSDSTEGTETEGTENETPDTPAPVVTPDPTPVANTAAVTDVPAASKRALRDAREKIGASIASSKAARAAAKAERVAARKAARSHAAG